MKLKISNLQFLLVLKLDSHIGNFRGIPGKFPWLRWKFCSPLHSGGNLNGHFSIRAFDLRQVAVMLDEKIIVFMKSLLIFASLGVMFSSAYTEKIPIVHATKTAYLWLN